MRKINIEDGRFKPLKDLRNHTAHIRMTASEKLQLRQMAKEQGKNMSELIMDALIRNKDDE